MAVSSVVMISEPGAGTNPQSVITEWSRQQRDTNRICCNGNDEQAAPAPQHDT
jgi:hypothetical protein